MKGISPPRREEVRRFPLNPCDYLILAFNRMLEEQGRLPGCTMMMMETEGEITPDRLRRALVRAITVHPTTGAGIRYTRLGGRPVWVASGELAEKAAAVFTHEDLRDRTDWLRRVDELSRERCAAAPDLMNGPQVRLDFYSGPRGDGRVCLRWRHEVMDGEGAQWFVSEIARLDEYPNAKLPSGLCPDGQHIDPLAGRSMLERWRLFWRGASALRAYEKVRGEGLSDRPVASARGLCLHHRVFEREETKRIESHARSACPSGPGLYARYLAQCVIRSLYRLHFERGISSEEYVIALPMRIQAPGPRPVPGNYLVWMTLRARRERVGDARALATQFHEQYIRFLDSNTMGADWEMYAIGALMGIRTYQKFLEMARFGRACVWGLSYYREIDPPIRRLAGARVTNSWLAHPVPAPTGLNPMFTRFGDRLNFSLTWLRDYISDELAEEFALLIEREALGGAG